LRRGVQNLLRHLIQRHRPKPWLRPNPVNPPGAA
jgi:hypothetical protein